MNAGNQEAWMARPDVFLCVAICGIIAGCKGSPSYPSGCCAPPGGGALAITFTPQDATFAAAAAEYRQLWADDGPRIIEAMERLTGLGFVDRQIDAIVFEG
jgi:hypothetical protein